MSVYVRAALGRPSHSFGPTRSLAGASSSLQNRLAEERHSVQCSLGDTKARPTHQSGSAHDLQLDKLSEHAYDTIDTVVCEETVARHGAGLDPHPLASLAQPRCPAHSLNEVIC